MDLESDIALRDGTTVQLRPSRQDDAARALRFLEGLSAESLYNRFLMTPHLDLARARTCVDVDQAVSLPNLSKCIVTSAEKKLVDTVKAVVLSVASDTFQAGTIAYNAGSTPPAVGLSGYHDNAALITPEIQAAIDAALAGLTDGSLDPCAPIKCTVSGS